MDYCFSENTDNCCFAVLRYFFDVLMPMNEIYGACSLDVVQKSNKALMDILVTLVYSSRTIMCNEYVDVWKIAQHLRYLFLIVEVISTGFIAPTPIEASKGYALKRLNGGVQGCSPRWERHI